MTNTQNTYKYTQIIDKGDETVRMIIIEDRGDRCLVEQINTTMLIRPTWVILTSEIELA